MLIPPHDDTVIAFDRVNVIRNGNYLVRGLSWQVELDERWVVLGPNGAGKTTVLNLASGRLHPSRGVAWVLGERLGRTDINELRTRIGLTTGQFAERVPPDEKVLDVVVTAAWSVVGRWRETYDPMDEARARQLLDQLGMGALVIDVGLIAHEREQLQSGADSAACFAGFSDRAASCWSRRRPRRCCSKPAFRCSTNKSLRPRRWKRTKKPSIRPKKIRNLPGRASRTDRASIRISIRTAAWSRWFAWSTAPSRRATRCAS